MAPTSIDIVNQALNYMGNDIPPVTGVSPTFDDTPAGKAAQRLYAPCIATVARSFGWDFARKTVALALTGNAAPAPWAFQYAYPPQSVEVWDIFPSDEDPNDPLPYNFSVANDVVSGNIVRVINTNLAAARGVYNNNPPPDAWDANFHEAAVRLLASEFAIALAAKPDLAAALQESYGAFEQIAESRQD